MKILEEFTINFFIWWYIYRFRELLTGEFEIMIAVNSLVHTWTHLRLLLTPLYGENSLAGRLISLPMRVIFVSIGLLLSIASLVFSLIINIIYVALPFSPVIILWTQI